MKTSLPLLTLAATLVSAQAMHAANRSGGFPATVAANAAEAGGLESRPSGTGAVTVNGELKQWHKVTLTLDGPFAHERDGGRGGGFPAAEKRQDEPGRLESRPSGRHPNPFTDLAFKVTFTHENGSPRYVVPGYFAGDGNAANTSAEFG